MSDEDLHANVYGDEGDLPRKGLTAYDDRRVSAEEATWAQDFVPARRSLPDLLLDLLPVRLQNKAKAIYAGGGGAILAYVLIGVVTGQWDSDAFLGLLLGPVIGGGTYAMPNSAVLVTALDDEPSA